LALTTRELLGLAVEQVADIQDVGSFFYATVNICLWGLA
jgi:hypothetical protein